MNITPELLALYAADIESSDPIDWADLSISEDASYLLIANSIIDLYNTTAAEDRDVMMLSTITKLVVENMVLNLRLAKIAKPST